MGGCKHLFKYYRLSLYPTKGTQIPDDMAQYSQVAIFLYSQPVSTEGEESNTLV